VACGSGKKRQTRTNDAAPVEPIALPADGAKPGDADEAEPNDSDDTATVLALGASMHGRIDAPFTDVDYYRIDVTTAGALALELSAVDQIDLTLEIQDGAGTVLARSDRGGVAAKEGVPNLGVQPGRYTAIVRQKKATVKGKPPKKPPPPPPVLPYDITAKLGAFAGNAEREPDDDRGTANDLIVGDPVTGYIGWTDDVDVWKLSVEALSAKNVIDLEIVAVENAAFTLEIADGVGAVLLSRKAPKGAGLIVKRFAPNLAPGAPPFHYVTIKATPSNPESAYSLRVTGDSPNPDDELEPNDTVDKPMAFPPERTVVDGWWSPGDIDCYAIPPDPAVRALQIDVETHPEGDLSAELLVDGKSVAKSDVKGKGSWEKVLATVPGNARAVLRIRGNDAGGQGAYKVKLGEQQ
jgi:hypothetical protein